MTYVVALDLKKAFDTVDAKDIMRILAELRAPIHLVNRIIEACVKEETSIQWYGQRTKYETKTKDVKQCCPLSPTLFVYALHDVLRRMAIIMPKITLNAVEDDIKLPMIFAYADDIVLLCDKREVIGEMLGVLKPLLLTVGLQLNTAKSNVLIRNPLRVEDRDTDQVERFDNERLKVVSKMKYLGVHLTDTLCRKEHVAERIKKAYKAMRVILPFVKRTKLPWRLTLRLYSTVIAPVVLYGMPKTYLTKSNWMALRAMEETILTTLRKAAARSADADEEPDHRMIEKMLDNKPSITELRRRDWDTGDIYVDARENISFESGSARDKGEI
jgi:hypothetical protein